jgi:hypothetical protein
MAILEEVKLDYSVSGVSELSAARKELEATARAGSNIETSIKGASTQVDKSAKQINQSAGGIKSTISAIGPAIVAAFSVGALINFQKQIIEITAKFQKYEAVLTNTLGSNSAAKKALLDIQDFAAKTPFSVDELTASFVKLANQGFTPNTTQLRQLGDLASSTGKSFDQLTEAILDAQSGQFERLKEFGIKASKSGDDVSFTFKGVTSTVKNTSAEIQKYILTLGDLKGVSGSMAAISGTLEGQISNLGDTFDSLLLSIGKNEAGGISGAISGLNTVLAELTKVIRGEYSELDSLRDLVSAMFTPLSKIIELFSVGSDSASVLNNTLKGLNYIFIGLEKTLRLSLLPFNLIIDNFIILKDVVTGAGIDKLKKDFDALFNTITLGLADDTKQIEGKLKAEEKFYRDKLAANEKFIHDKLEADKKAHGVEVKTEQELTEKQKKEAEKRRKEEAAARQKQIDDEQKYIADTRKRLQDDQKRIDADLAKYEDKKNSDQLKKERTFLKQQGLQITQNDQLIADRKKAMQQKQLMDFIEITKKQVLITQQATDIISNLIQITGDRSGALAAFQKTVATVEIGISTAKAIAQGISSAQAVPFPGNLLAITTTIATVLGNIAQAKQILQSSGQVPKFKFADGVIGLQGPGTSKSDSIPAMLSKGESVITASATSKYRPLLEEIQRETLDIPNNYGGNPYTIDYGKLAKALSDELGSLPFNHFSMDERGFSHYVLQGNSRKQIINRRYKGGV